ncbi:MAG: glycoside hydrolase family 9 protein [Paludibacteraceae bacterium]|nr:glycoside hydrolase family 9 protein [Paludibacteraceae bacterium]
MMRFKFTILALVCSLAGAFTASAADLSFDKEQYQKALWMTTRFYGAQRMGDGVNWLIATHEPNGVANGTSFSESKFVKGKSYLKDADGSYDLTGGWFDCGDFVLFGQTFFYSAYMLALGYSEFPEGYDDYYSFDYHGYISADDYTWEGKKGAPNGIPDILDEVKYATDFILKAIRDDKTFYYQKGNGGYDHAVWCTSSVKSAMPKAQGGESDGTREILKASGNVTSMVALGGAALAVMSRVYKKFDPEYAQKCLEKAKVAHDFVNGTSKGNTSGDQFYGAKPKYVTDMVILEAELYRATKDSKYLNNAEGECSWMDSQRDYNYNYTLCYNNTEDLAAYLMASIKESSYSSKATAVLDFYVNSMYKPSSGYVLRKEGHYHNWGTLRYPANQAFVYALYSKLMGDKELNPYALTTIEFILGKNPTNTSFVVGFGNKHPVIPHHRNFFRYDGNNMANIPVPDKNYKFIQFGFMVGGDGATLTSGSYSESLSDYERSEGGIDYNAGLVGALGYINSIINPVNVNKFGHPSPEFEPTVSLCGMRSVTLDSKVPADGKKTFTWYKDGQKVESSTSASSYQVTAPGEYTCEIDSAGDWTTSGSVVVVASLPEFEPIPDMELCNPSQIEMDFSLGDSPVTYQWYRNGEALKGATSSKYVVTKGGEYTCEISASNCESTGATFKVVSLLPEVEDAVSDVSGNVTLTVKGDGEYEWYDTPEGGSPLATGSSYKTTISADKTFYVQDAGAIDFVVGPAQKDFTSTAVNWGNISANFTSSKACNITSVYVHVDGNPYNQGQTTVKAELGGAKKKTFTSDPIQVSKGNQFVKITFSTPIEIPGAGDYTLTFSSDAFAISYYDNMSNYSSFAHQGEPFTFTSAGDGKTGFPGIADWNVTTGSGCARAVVFAKKGSASGVEDVENALCAFYPNPVSDLLTVKLNTVASATAQVFDLMGTVVAEKQLNASDMTLDLRSLPAGIYVVRVIAGDSIYTERIVKE